jgi:paraquat-inducible protein A
MIEVFMLGVLVSLAKLAHVAAVEPGVALWSFGALVILLAAAASSFEPHELWARVDRLA